MVSYPLDRFRHMSRIRVEPDVMIWARRSIGLSVAEAAKRIDVSIAVLESWETGERHPTVAQFRKAAAVYKRPTFVLKLHRPPTDFQPMRDFRRADAAPMPYWLNVGIRRALEQLDFFEELAEFAPSVERSLPTLHSEMEPVDAVALLRDTLGVSLDRQQSWNDADDALAGWREAAIRFGVFVMQFERVGVDDARGLSRRGTPYSVIGLNAADSPRGKIFSLIHGITHLALDTDRHVSVCDTHPRTSVQIERFCNRVAGATLLPTEAAKLSLRGMRDMSQASLLSRLYQVGTRFHVSSEVVLVRAIELGYLDGSAWERLVPELHKLSEDARLARVGKAGGDYYTTVISRYGRTYVESVIDAFSADALTLSSACSALELKVEQMPRLIGALR